MEVTFEKWCCPCHASAFSHTNFMLLKSTVLVKTSSPNGFVSDPLGTSARTVMFKALNPLIKAFDESLTGPTKRIVRCIVIFPIVSEALFFESGYGLATCSVSVRKPLLTPPRMHPTLVEVNLEYTSTGLRLRIRDVACGFEPHSTEAPRLTHS